MSELVLLAEQIAKVCLHTRKGERVWIHSWDHTVDLASEVAFSCRQRGAYVLSTVEIEKSWMRSLRELPKDSLEVLPAHKAAALEKTDFFVFMLGPRSTISWSLIPSEKRELADVWYLGKGKYVEKWRSIGRQRCVRMLGVEYCLVTEERARALGIDFGEWRSVMLAGCLSDQRRIAKRALTLSEILRTRAKVEIRTPHGTDLNFRLIGRKPNVGDSLVSKDDASKGIVKFVPSGFVEVAPDEDSAQGTLVYDVPVSVGNGKKIEGLTLKFRDGRVVDYSARSGLEAFREYVESGAGETDRFGFFGLGLNPGLKHGFTQDDKVLGGVTLGIGGNADKGGKNSTEGNVHWWASMTKATVRVGDTLILEQGKPLFS